MRRTDSLPKSYTIHIANPLMPVISAQEAWLNGTAVTVPGQDLSVYNWRTSFTDIGDIFCTWNRFEILIGRVTRHGYCIRRHAKPDQNAPDWNGIVETTESVMHRLHQTKSMWHIFEQPGYYTVTLRVRRLRNRDSNSTTIGIWVSRGPTISTEALISENLHMLEH